MKHNTTDNKYKEGTEVYALEYPNVKLIIRRYVDRIYYCKIKKDPNQDEVVYFERELRPVAEAA